METAIKKTTTDAFCEAVNAAKDLCKKHPRKTKVAYRSELWVDKNQEIIKVVAKKQVAIKAKMQEEYDIKSIDLAIEKDGRLVMDESGRPAMSKENKKALIAFQNDINKRASEETDVLMAEEIECKILPLLSEYTDDLDFATMKALQGFVIELKKEFED